MYRVALINPPVPEGATWVREGRCQQWDIWGAAFPPLSLALISTQLETHGFETIIVDSGPEGKDLASTIDCCKRFSPDLVIISTTTPTIRTDLTWFAPGLKKCLPKTKVAVIGIHVTALPSETLEQFDTVDFVIKGEPELTSLELVKALSDHVADLSAVLGIGYRLADRKIVVNPDRPFVTDLDSLGIPNWNKVQLNKYKIPIKETPFTLISFSRGCPFSCKFCASHTYYGNQLRKRSVPSLIGEIRFNLAMGVRDFLFWTELITLDKPFLTNFLNAIFKEGLEKKIRWVCNSRTDTSDYKLFKLMKDAGCWQIAFGLEFGNDEILRLAQKGGRCSVKQGFQAVEQAHKAGLCVDGHFIMGYPGETVDTLKSTIGYALSLPLTYAHFYAAVPFPGSVLYQESIVNKFVSEGSYDGFNQDRCSLITPDLSPQDVEAHIKMAYRKFYLRPITLYRSLKVPGNSREMVSLLRTGIRFLRHSFLHS